MRAGKVCALYNSRSRFSRFADALPRPTAAAPGGGKNFFVQNAENPLTKSTFHAKISKSSGLTDAQEVNMGVFPSGQWGQTVNLLLSASVVRIHPRPPRKRLCRNTQAFFLCNPAAAIDAGGFEQHRPAEQSGGQKGPCGAFLDARLANPQLSHNCLVSPNGDDRVELFVICSFPIGHAGGFEPKNRGTPHAGHASVFLMFLFCYLTLPCAPAAAGTNRTRCSARRPPEWKWGPPGRSWSGWRSAGCS